MTSCLLNLPSAARNLTTAVVNQGRPAHSSKVLQRLNGFPPLAQANTRITARATPQPTASLRGSGPASVVPVLDQRCRRVRAGLQPASAARQRTAAGAHACKHLRQDRRYRLRPGLRGVLHRGMAGVRPPHCRGRDLLDDLWHLDADQRALAHGPSDAWLLHHRHRQHHCTGDVAHRIERVVCQPKGVCRDRCGEHREHRLSLVERGWGGSGRVQGADTARVLVDQFAVAVPGCAVPAAQGTKRAEGAADVLIGRRAGTWTTIERVGLRRR